MHGTGGRIKGCLIRIDYPMNHNPFEDREGGEYTDHLPESYLRVAQTKRAKRVKRKKGGANKTKKTTNQMRREKRRIAWEHFKGRMNLPIGSSPYGMPLSEDIKRDMDELRKRLQLV